MVYATMMMLGQEFPPIKVIFRDNLYYVIDGNHRVAAALSMGYSILADVIDYEDASDEEVTLVGIRFSK